MAHVNRALVTLRRPGKEIHQTAICKYYLPMSYPDTQFYCSSQVALLVQLQ